MRLQRQPIQPTIAAFAIAMHRALQIALGLEAQLLQQLLAMVADVNAGHQALEAIAGDMGEQGGDRLVAEASAPVVAGDHEADLGPAVATVEVDELAIAEKQATVGMADRPIGGLAVGHLLDLIGDAPRDLVGILDRLLVEVGHHLGVAEKRIDPRGVFDRQGREGQAGGLENHAVQYLGLEGLWKRDLGTCVATRASQLWRGGVSSGRGAASFFARPFDRARIENTFVMLIGVLLAINIVVCLGLIGVVLLQRSEGGALGMGGGSSSFMTARGAGDLLTRITWILFSIFLLISLALTILTGRLNSGGSVVDRLDMQKLDSKTLNAAPVAPAPADVAPSTAAPAPIQAPTPQLNAPAPAAAQPSLLAPAPQAAPAKKAAAPAAKKPAEAATPTVAAPPAE